jgi:hypothetical protein
VLEILEEAGEQTTDQSPLAPSEKKRCCGRWPPVSRRRRVAARLDASAEEVRSRMVEVLGKLEAQSRLHALLTVAWRDMGEI